MTEAEYQKAPGIRWTHLRAMSISPAHFQASVVMGGADETYSLRLGRAIDCAALEPERYEREWITFPGERRGNAWLSFKAKHADREILNEKESAFVVSCVAALRRNPLAPALLRGRVQELVTWTDDATGLRCKARPDVARGGTPTDLKTARDVTPKAFGWAAYRYGYHGQLAFYADGLRASGARADGGIEAVIIALETHEPWDVVCYELLQPAMDAGRALYQRLLLMVLECEAKYGPARPIEPGAPVRLWPGRSPDRMIPLELPDKAIEEAVGPLDFGDGVEISW